MANTDIAGNCRRKAFMYSGLDATKLPITRPVGERDTVANVLTHCPEYENYRRKLPDCCHGLNIPFCISNVPTETQLFTPFAEFAIARRKPV